MYLVSIYFDDETNKTISHLIKRVAEKTGNYFMLENNVLPHITVSAFEAMDDFTAVNAVSKVKKKFKSGEIKWVSTGTFFPYVIYIAPVLNQYLHDLCNYCYEVLEMEGLKVSRYYSPFSWFPHTTVGKKLTTEQMEAAFKVMQNNFGIIDGKSVRIGLAKTNPYRELL